MHMELEAVIVFTTINQGVAFLVAMGVQFIPLLGFVPFVIFIIKGVGGVGAMIIGKAAGWSNNTSEAVKGNVNNPDSLRNLTTKNVTGAMTQTQAQTYRSLNNASRAGGVRGWVAGRAARIAATGNVLAREARQNEEAKKKIYGTKDNGDDSILNARTATQEMGRDGKMRWVTLDGKEVTDTERALAKKFYKTMPEIQAIAPYRETKTLSNEDAETFTGRFGRLADQEKWTPEETTSQWMGTAFARQDERGELKHGTWSRDANGRSTFSPAGGVGTFFTGSDDLDAKEGKTDAFVKETYYKKGSVKGSNMLSSHPRALLNAKKEYVARLNDTTGQVTNLEKVNAEARLKQVLEVEQAFESPMLDEEATRATGQMTYISRMAGASAGTIAAFNELKAYNGTNDPGGHIARLQGDLRDPQNSYETVHEAQRKNPALTGRYIP